MDIYIILLYKKITIITKNINIYIISIYILKQFKIGLFGDEDISSNVDPDTGIKTIVTDDDGPSFIINIILVIFCVFLLIQSSIGINIFWKKD